MRLLIFFLLLLLGAEASNAQIIRANAFYRPTAVIVSDTLLLDSFPAAAAYSVRKLRTAYTGSCMRVRKNSDNSEQDIGFANNYLDTVSLKTFVGTSNGFVVTWYDQSGNGRNANANTVSRQPKIYDSATASITKRNSKVSLSLDGGDRLDVTTGLDIYQNKSYAYCFHVACNTTTTGLRYLMQTTTNIDATRFAVSYNTGAVSQRNSVIARRLDADASASFTGTSNYSSSNLEQITTRLEWTNGDLYLYRNSTGIGSNLTFLTSGSTSNTASLLFYLFNVTASNIGITGSCSEIILYNTDESSNITKIEKNINKYYQLYWDGTKQGMLDTYAGAAVAYSLRNLKSTYTGPLIKVRRSSDNIETDIYGDYNGNLDTSELKSFIGANDAFITTWYNQGDSTAVNFTQTTAASQPRIMTSGVIERIAGEPTIRFDVSGTSDFMDVASSTVKFNYLHQAGQAAVFSIVQAAVSNSNPNTAYTFLSNAEVLQPTRIGYSFFYDDRSVQSLNNSIRVGVTNGTATVISASPNNYFTPDTLRLITQLLDIDNATAANRIAIYINGANESKINASTATPSTSNASFNMRLGRSSNSTAFPLNGYVSEIIFYPTDQSSNRTGIETNINNYYGLW